jgi:hypothetical protein
MLTVDMNPGPSDAHEAAYSRLLRLIRGHKVLLDGILNAPEAARARNWKLKAIKAHPDIKTLRTTLAYDPAFADYLAGKLAVHFGADYVKKLLTVFMK